ncbi:MAG TPA: LUD domain-containing protein, partial [Thermomicrobiales bacterium]|nr:LUD domain-containing protein [Thermomicrobiales bacterium]
MATAAPGKPDRKLFKKRVDAAVADKDLATALDRALPEFGRRRLAAFEGQDFPGKRRRVRDLKQRALDKLPELVERFTREAEAVGAQVHSAATPEDARRIVLDIARQHDAKLIVKSKSMVSEEIHLNHALEEAGMRVVETDLGEYIIQLAGDTPSHLIAPAIHVTREQVAELLSKRAGEALPAEVEPLVRVARKLLRDDFVNADIGISGANIAIAESGTLVIVSNEGNGRLVTTLPPVHIAILGVEKIVETLDDATDILKVLPRSGTGQKITSYVSFITGPSRTADIELTLATGVHGPGEVHIILLDNGRWAAREDPELREALQCIRCGACSNVCPPYQIVGGHLFGHIYTGPIGLIMTAMHHGLEHAAGPQSLCVSCNACETVCPAEIPIPRLIMNVRERVAEQYGLPRLKEMAVARWSEPSSGQRWAGLAARAASVIAGDDGIIRNIPLAPDAMTTGRHLRAPVTNPLRKRVASNGLLNAPAAVLPSSQAKGLTVAYFPGCMIDRLAPEMGEAALRVLAACGCKVEFPQNQHCCGLVALNMGDRAHGRKMAEQTISMLEGVQADWIVTNTTSCLAAIVDDYRALFRDEPDWLARVDKQAARMIEFTRFLVEVAQIKGEDFGAPGQGDISAVTYHDACQSHNALGLGATSRKLITEVLGIELREMADSAVCCGFGGSFSVDYPQVSAAILAKKLRNAEQTGAHAIVADNPGCLMQI